MLKKPIWKICSSKWESSPNRGENKKKLDTTTQTIIPKPEFEGILGRIPLLFTTIWWWPAFRQVKVAIFYDKGFGEDIAGDVLCVCVCPAWGKLSMLSSKMNDNPYQHWQCWPSSWLAKHELKIGQWLQSMIYLFSTPPKVKSLFHCCAPKKNMCFFLAPGPVKWFLRNV